MEELLGVAVHAGPGTSEALAACSQPPPAMMPACWRFRVLGVVGSIARLYRVYRLYSQGQTDQDGVWGRMAHSLRQRPSNPPSLRRNPWPSSNPRPGPCGLRRTSGVHLAFVEPSRFFFGFVLAFCIGLRRTPSPFVEPPGLRRTFARPPGLRRTSSRPVGIPSLRRSSPAILLFGHPDVFSLYIGFVGYTGFTATPGDDACLLEV